MAIGRDLLGDEELTEPLRVWYHNGEDPREELDRRIAAICIHYSIDEQEVRATVHHLRTGYAHQSRARV
jgi:RecA-family ATPase